MTWLKQSTAVTVPIGPIVDSTDGATAETGFTISQADIRLSKNGGAFAQTNNATGASHMENGWYGVPLDTTDTNTLGELIVNIAESGGLQVWARFMVVPANVWDSYFGADLLQVDVTQWLGGTPSGLSGGRVQALAAALSANTLTASALATDAVTEIVDAVWANVARTLTADTNINYPSAATIAASVLTTAMTEAYATDGAAPTLTEAVLLTLQHLSESSISGTTKTVKKLDGSTTAATFTLDDATTPTAITRAS